MTRPDARIDFSSRRAVLAVLFLLTLVGVGASTELTYIYHEANRDLGHVSHCHLSAKWDCDNVARSRYARFLGVPVALWGVAGYLLMALLVGQALFGWRLPGRAPPTWPLGSLGILLAGALAMTGYLMYASFVVLGKKCLWCAVLYGVNAGLLITWSAGLWVHRVSPVAVVRRDLAWLLSHQRTLGIYVGAGLVLAALAFAVGPRLGHVASAPGAVDVERLVHGPAGSGRDAPRAGARSVLTRPASPPKWLAELVGPHTPARGPQKADLYIVEFSDYQCPFCQMSNRVMEQVLQKYGRRIRLYHHHFPLDKSCFKKMRYQMHEHACFAARAAVCAGRQGKFWAFHDALFRLGRSLSPASIRDLARRLGLAQDRFQACLQSALARRIVQDDLALGMKLKVRGTPTFYIGGPRVDRFQPESISLALFDKLFAAIDRAGQRPAARGQASARARPATRPTAGAPMAGTPAMSDHSAAGVGAAAVPGGAER